MNLKFCYIYSSLGRTLLSSLVASLVSLQFMPNAKAVTAQKSHSHLSQLSEETSKCQVDSADELKLALDTFKSKTGQKPAAVCIEILSNRLNIVVFTQSGKFTPQDSKNISVNLEELRSEIELLRNLVGDDRKISKIEYLIPASKLYQWIVKPIQNKLENEKIDTIIFNVELELPSFPIEVLYDSSKQQHLIEQYAVTRVLDINHISQYSKTLDDPNYGEFKDTQVLVMGASTIQGGERLEIETLPGILDELRNVGGNWNMIPDNSELQLLFNDGFTRRNIQQKINENNFSLVFIATHGFIAETNLRDYYLQLWDEAISLKDLNNLLGSQKLELLVLSACNSAFNTEDGTFELEALVSPSKIKTLLASQHTANNVAAYIIMNRLSRSFIEPSIISKLAGFRKDQALREVQEALLHKKIYMTKDGYIQILIGEKPASIKLPSDMIEEIKNSPEIQDNDTDEFYFDHPYFWAAFTLIGSPW